MSKIQYVLIALAAAVVILAAGSIYTVNQGEQALVLQFGRPVRVVKEPGLKLKIPMIQNVVSMTRGCSTLIRRRRKWF